MALTKVLTGGLALDAVDNTILKLDDDYALTGAISGAGGLVPLLDTTVSSAVSQFDITSTHINATYDTYKLICMFHPANNDVRLEYQFFADTDTNGNGSLIGGNVYGFSIAQKDVSGDVRQSNAATPMEFSYSTIGNVNGEAIAFEMTLYNSNDVRMPIVTSGEGTNYDINGYTMGFDFAGGMVPPQTYLAHFCRGIRFEFSGGNIELAQVRLWGIANA